MGNFAFLKSHWEDLGNTGELAENYVYSDPYMKQKKPVLCMQI